jgi:signal transduction histidine kinase
MKKTEIDFQKVLNAIDDLVLVKAEKSKILWANDSFLNYYGMSRDELKNLIDSDHSDPDNTLQYVKDDAEVFETKKKVSIPSEPVTNSKNEVHYFHTIKTPIFEGNEVVQLVGVSRQNKSENLIKASEERQEQIKSFINFQRDFMTNLDLPGLFVDASGRIVFASSSFLKMFSLEPENFQNKDFDTVFDGTDMKIHTLSDHSRLEFNNMSLKFNGVFAFGDFTAIPWFFDTNVSGGHYLIFKNRTEEHKLNKKLQTAIKKSIWTDKLRSLGEISAGVGHEINNPLSAILGTIEKLEIKAEKAKLPDSIAKDLERIERNANRISQIVNSLRALSRDSSEDEPQECKLRDVINEALSVTADRFRRHEVKLEPLCSDDITVRIRPGEITRVFINLINNSIDAIKNDNSPWVKIECSKNQDGCFIRFSDSGKGIPEKIAERIFDPFFTTKEFGEGTGLGLGICHDIVKSHGGELTYVDSQSNTTFLIRMPS